MSAAPAASPSTSSRRSEPYADRRAAGVALAQALTRYADRPDVIVLGLPRGGVPVAAEVARALHAPLDVLVVRKLGAPTQPELALGAIAPGGVRYIDEALVMRTGTSASALAAVEAEERRELGRREVAFREGRPAQALRGRTALLVDDGIATGATMIAAVRSARAAGAVSVVMAVPVAPAGCSTRFAGIADDVVIPWEPAGFLAVGQWYRDFPQCTDAEVIRLLRADPAPPFAAATASLRPPPS